jgi:hypothetical protein
MARSATEGDQVLGTTAVRRTTLAAVTAAGASLIGLAGIGAPVAQAAPASLHIAGQVKLTVKSAFGSFSEAPGNAVYYADGHSVYVVHGTTAPVRVLTVSHAVLAVGANATDFFTVTGTTVTAYNRANREFAGRWKLSSPAPPTSAGVYAVGNRVWAWTDWSTDSSGLEYATVSTFLTSAPAVRTVNNGGAFPDDFAAGTTGLYYQAITTATTLFRALPDGSLRKAHFPWYPGPLALARGRVVALVSRYVKGVRRVYLTGYKALSLTRAYTRRVASSYTTVAGTGAGLLAISAPCPSGVCASATVLRLSAWTGAVTGSVLVPGALNLLAGPRPAVIRYHGGSYYLVLLAG